MRHGRCQLPDVQDMPITITNWPAHPECLGTQWAIQNQNQLVELIALVLLGRARHAARVIHGAEQGRDIAIGALKSRLREQLVLPADALPYHRDGLLFEVICWIAAQQGASAGEFLSDPHLQATHQGMDGLKVSLNPVGAVSAATIYEQKCSTNPRTMFRDEVLPAFREYIDQKRDNQITQVALGLLAQAGLTEEQERMAYHALIATRPFVFSANLTVEPAVFPQPNCLTLFADYSDLTANIATRLGNTFPLADTRAWFAQLAGAVMARIDAVPNV